MSRMSALAAHPADVVADDGLYAPQYFTQTLAAFELAHPAYATTRRLDELRATEYGRLDRLQHTYLDYTGGSLYADTQLRRHQDLLAGEVFGNPHSNNPTSLAMTRLVEQARAQVLAYFCADPAEYTAVFTANASGALKLVGEAYPFGPGGRYLLTYDNHNSVNGIREYARARGAAVTYLPTRAPDLRVEPALVTTALAQPNAGGANLFAYPAQSNFSGVQHPLAWVAQAQAAGWDVLLDAAAFAPTNRLDLSLVKPDFVSLSFYKIFGYPTGVGVLLAKHTALARLRRPWFAGGTISLASVQDEGWHHLLAGSAGFEDGTINYLSLPAVEIGLRWIDEIGIETIHTRVNCLTGWLLTQLQTLRHVNGAPLARIFGPADTQARGATVAFMLYDPAGVAYDFRQIEALATERKLSLRTGCFCNPGDGEVAHGITRAEMAQCFTGHGPVSYQEFYGLLQAQSGKTPSTVRVSLGVASNFADVYRFMSFVESFRNRPAAELAWRGPAAHPDLARDAA